MSVRVLTDDVQEPLTETRNTEMGAIKLHSQRQQASFMCFFHFIFRNVRYDYFFVYCTEGDI